MDFQEIFWSSSLEDLRNGFVYLEDEEVYICLCCCEIFESGMVYQVHGKMMDARKAISRHIELKHKSMFHFLIEMDKKYTSLTDNQKALMLKFYEGRNDKEIAKEMGTSSSTIRNKRFTLREKGKQAKIFLAIMNLLEDKMKVVKEDKFISIHRNATNVDERYAITEGERKTYLKNYFQNKRLISFPKKQKRIIVVLQHICSFFKTNQVYTEKEVNEILKKVYPDYVTIRRYLIEYGFLNRKSDGSEYWVKL